MNKLRSMSLAAAALALTACGDMPGISHQSVGGADTLATKADSRLVYARRISTDAATGKLQPNEVICAEPSPDVANAFSTAFGTTAEAEAKALPALSAAGDVNASLSLSRSRSEAIAQLGKRLGTIQLLRNGLFSACEAYANGAISPISYAFLLSRFGDVMVTLLAIELVSGDGVGSDNTTTTASSTAPPSSRDKAGSGGAGTVDAASGASANAGDATAAAMKKALAGTNASTKAVAKAGTTSANDADGQGSNGVKDPGKDGTVGDGSTPETTASATSTPGKTDKGSLSDAQTAAIVQLQQTFLRGSEAGPLVLACSVALDRASDANRAANGGPLGQSGSTSDLPSTCGKFLADYGQMVVNTISAERYAQASVLTRQTANPPERKQPRAVGAATITNRPDEAAGTIAIK
ncbi:hypothetical protein ACMX25_17110 [Caballeronia sp. 15715]|uniref:hypothetical protein n=1 Tax=Caballeronia sp. 15715 TaxID=3391030 RepID=UPI0039E35467